MAGVGLVYGLAVAAVGLLGGGLAVWNANEAKSEAQEAKATLLQVEMERDAMAWNLALAERRIDTAVQQRDDYAAIASTHTVNVVLPEPENRQVWHKRRYAGLPSSNLNDIAQDMERYNNFDVELAVTIEGGYGWGPILAKAGWVKPVGRTWTSWLSRLYQSSNPGDACLTFHGSPERVHRQLTQVLTASGVGLANTGPQGDPVWKLDTPLVMHVSLTLLHVHPEATWPTVEVLRVQHTFEAAKRPVLLRIDNAEAWTDERLVDLLEGVVETHNLLRPDQDSTLTEEVSVPLLAVVEQT